MRKKYKEWLSIQMNKYPGRVVLTVILVFNVVFFFLSAGIISALSLKGTEHMSFIEAAFCTITMILDAGCIQFVISDIGKSGVLITVVCLAIILIGMISFTGSVIGYVTNYISHFIENANTGKHHLHISDHTVILNWNSRASEIVNDLLYSPEPQKVIVLVSSRKAEIEQEIEERLADTVARENRAVQKKYRELPFFQLRRAMAKEYFKRRVTVIVREGDVFSSKQLHDISVETAKAVIILGNDINNNGLCRVEYREKLEANGKGNSQTVKILMQVADITAAETSADNQRIIVEITDDWTGELVDRIIACKQVDGKCNIVPVRINKILGQILSQFSLMPELNIAFVHGKLKNAEKDRVMRDFSAGNVDVLVSTTVIEVGVNVPNATLMIVENAERFGLSQLHQLRGRVGRGSAKSYFILVSDARSESARSRLAAIRSTTDGYRIAEYDLEQRGPGDFLGSDSIKQHGQMRLSLAAGCRDTGLIESAAALAKEITAADPDLSDPGNRGLSEKVRELLRRSENIVN